MESNCLRTWALNNWSLALTQCLCWELKAKEGGHKITRESIKAGVTKLDWAAICGVKRGADLDIDALNKTVHADSRRQRKKTSANYFH